MKRRIVLFLTMLIAFGSIINAQTVDNTALLDEPINTSGVVFAALSFNDVNSNGVHDATFVLSEPAITAWGDYSAAIAFYSNLEVRLGTAGWSGTSTVTSVPVETDKLYYLWFDLDVAATKYSVYVKTDELSEPALLYTDAAFRNTSVSSITRWSTLHNPDGEPDTVSAHHVSGVSSVGEFPAEFSDASLSAIEVSAGTLSPAFDPSVYEYALSLPEGAPIVEITPVTNSFAASFTGGGSINVSSGMATESINVTAADGETSLSYTLNISVEGNYAMSLPGGSDGSVSNVALPDLGLSSLPVTIEAWVYPITKNDYGAVLYYRSATNGGVQFDKWDNPQSFRGIDPGAKQVVATNNVRFNDWNHVAYVVTATDMKIYLNGIETANTSDVPSAFTFDAGTYIGWDAALADRTIQGYFDEVRVWNIEKTAEDIENAKYDVLTGTETGLVAYYNFDDQAAVATDVTSGGKDGTINGGTYVSSFVRSDSDGDGIPDFIDNCPESSNADQGDMDEDGIGDSCDDDMDGDGVPNDIDNCIDTPNEDQTDLDQDGIGDICDPEVPEGLNFALSLPGGNDGNQSNVTLPAFNISSLPVTIEMWYKPDPVQNEYSTLWYNRQTSANSGVQYDRWTDQSKIKAVWNSSSRVPDAKPDAGQWNHVALVVTSTSKTLYINDEPYIESGTYINYAFSEPTYLGWDPVLQPRTLKGLIDEVRVWTVERSAEDIADNKYKVLNGDEAGLLGYWNFDDRADNITDLTANAQHGTNSGGTYVLSTLFDSMYYDYSVVKEADSYVGRNTAGKVALVLDILTKNKLSPLTLKQLDFSATGTTTLSDIANVSIYSTNADSTFNTSVLVAEIKGSPENESFSLAMDHTLLAGSNILWVAIDIAGTAEEENIIDLACTGFSIASEEGETQSHSVSEVSTTGSLEVNSSIFKNNTKLPVDIVTKNATTSAEGSNFASFQQNAIMTFNGYQYVTFWNKVSRVCIARKELPAGEWKTLELTDYTVSPSRVADNHYTISMGICENDGTIHLAFDHHNDDLNYRVSVDSLAYHTADSLWVEDSFGPVRDYLEDGVKLANITYPRFISKPDGDLIYECRIGWSGDGDDFLWEYTAEDQSWTYIGEYLNGTSVGENAYINGVHYDPSGNMHVSWVWRQTPDARTNHDIYYAYSDDDGRTWKNAEGTLVGTAGSSPVTMSAPGLKVWTVGTYRGLINQESQAVDSKGGIHILQTYMLDEEPNNSDFWGSRINFGYLRHIHQDESGVWQNDVIAKSGRDRSEIAVDAHDNLYVVSSEDYRVFFASAEDGWKNWTELDLSGMGTVINEVLIDREALLYYDILSFVATHSANNGTIIAPHYLLGRSTEGTGSGLQEVVYKNSDFSIPLRQELSSVDMTGEDLSGFSQEVGIRWKGDVEIIEPEEYMLHLTTNGNVNLYINDSLLIETGALSSTTEFTDTLPLYAGYRYKIVLEGIFSDAGNVVAELEWSSKNQQQELVPLTELYGELEDLNIGIEPFNSEDGLVEIYPNPSASEFTMKLTGKFEYQIYSIDGKLLASGEAYNSCVIGEKLSSGTYFVKVRGKEVEEVKRIVKL